MENISKQGRIQDLYEKVETQVYIDEYKIRKQEEKLAEDESFDALKKEIIDRKGDSFFDVLMLKEYDIDMLRRTVRSLRLKEYMSIAGDKNYPDYDINIPDDKLLLFHNTTEENAEEIAFSGLKASAGKDQGRGLDGDFVWGTTEKNLKGYGGYTIAFTVDKDKAEPYKVNDTEYTLPFDIPAEDIVFIDEPIGLNNSRESDIKKLVDKYGKDKVAEVLAKKTNFDADAIGHMISKALNESERLDEKSLLDLIDDSKANDPKRIELAKTIYTNYKGVDSDGTLLFESDSQTRSSLTHRQRVFYPGFFDLLDTVDAGDEITEEQVVDIITGDLMVDCSCFTGETLVAIPKGFKYIKDIEVGDVVLTHTGEYKEVVKVFDPYESEILEVKVGTRTLYCTPNHPFLTIDNEWLPISDCEDKELVCYEVATGTISPIGKPIITELEEKATVYNFEVADNNSYCVGQNRVIVHNCESFLYYAWAYKSWSEDYGLMKELRAPQRNNIDLKGGACKHVLSVLDLINRSNSLFDRVARDLNILFQKYKKRSPQPVEPEETVEEPTKQDTGE